ncbi:DUF3368 domain-containing protein [Candidatus Woesearchaeota archaeon]|nr:DUF3368 domain-containing protein [Candidatus Woesearchaeota archaeon]
MIVSNATPLIYLAKIQKLYLLRMIFREIVISEDVKKEVVDEGKRLGKSDAAAVEESIGAGWIKVRRVPSYLPLPIELDKGEISIISLAKGIKASYVLIDEIPARAAAKLVGLQPRGTIFVLLAAVKKKELSFEEFLECLNSLVEEGFRLREEIYINAVEEARKMTKSKP